MGVDLNRNFDFEWGGEGASAEACSQTFRGARAASEPETQAIAKYLKDLFPDARGEADTDAAPDSASGIFLDIHAHGRLMLWPWGHTTTPAPNRAQLRTLGRKLAFFNGHLPMQLIGLYLTHGTTNDYAYGELGVASYTFELGTTFFQPCDYFENTILARNLRALRYALKAVRAPYAIPAGPDALDVAVSAGASPTGVPAGTPVTLSATLSDERYSDRNGVEPAQAIAAGEYYVDVLPWGENPAANAMTAADGAFDQVVEDATASVDTTEWRAGRHIVFARAQDADGHWGAVSAVFLFIDNDAGGVTVTPTRLGVVEGATATYTVVLKSKPTADVTIAATSSAPGKATVAPASHTFTPSNWSTGKTFTVTGKAPGPSTIGHAVTASTDGNYPTSLTIESVAVTVEARPIVIPPPPPPPVLSSDATLSALALSAGALVFDSATTSYAVEVASHVASVTVTPTVTDAGATVTVNGTAVESGEPSAAIALVVGETVIEVVVTAEDGTATRTYAVTVTRAAAPEVTPTRLGVVEGATATYTVVLKSKPTADVTIAATSSAPGKATVAPASHTFTPSNWSTGKTFTVTGKAPGPSTIGHAVTASTDGNYPTSLTIESVAVTVEARPIVIPPPPPPPVLSSDATLSALALSAGALVFDSATTSYAVEVASHVASVTVTPTVTDAGATVTVNGTAVESGEPSAAIALVVGETVIEVVVTAEDGTATRTYAVTVTRAAAPEVTPTRLGVVEGATATYTVVLKSKPTADVTIAATSSAPGKATVAPASHTFTPSNWSTGKTFTVTGKAPGPSTIGHAVTASTDGNYPTSLTIESVAVTVEARPIVIPPPPPPPVLSSDATLSALALSAGALVFDSATTSYAVEVASHVASVTVTPTVTDAGATVTVNGTAVESGEPSAAIALVVGETVIEVVVTAEDGTATRTYAVTVTRAAAPEVTPTRLGVVEGATATYTVVLKSKPTADVTIAATSSAPGKATVAPASHTFTPSNWSTGKTFTVTGKAPGPSTIGHAVTASTDGNYPTSLTIESVAVTVEARPIVIPPPPPPPVLSSDATLSTLALSAGALVFDSATTSYAVEVASHVASVTVTPTVTDAGATVTVNGTAVESGEPSAAIALVVGETVIEVVVTAEDGTATRTYAVTVTRAAAPEVALVPPATSALQGFVRVVNASDRAGTVRVRAFDDAGEEYSLMLKIDAHEVVHFNSNDLESGNAAKGLTGGTGPGEGNWRLAFETDLDVQVLGYVRAPGGFVTSMHDTVAGSGGVYEVAFFNPGSNTSQVSVLRLVNRSASEAAVTIRGLDDTGEAGAGEVRLTIPAGAARMLRAPALESGGEGFEGALGDGRGKWRLRVASDQPLAVMSLLASPTGHLTNLSTTTAPARR